MNENTRLIYQRADELAVFAKGISNYSSNQYAYLVMAIERLNTHREALLDEKGVLK